MGDRIERRDTRNPQTAGDGQPLSKGESDSNPGEGTGTLGHRDPVELGDLHSQVGKQAIEPDQDLLAMLAPEVELEFAQCLIVALEREPEAGGRGFDPEH